jgi:hypothetical protein
MEKQETVCCLKINNKVEYKDMLQDLSEMLWVRNRLSELKVLSGKKA